MEFKSTREAFDWLQQYRPQHDDRDCWLAVWQYEAMQDYAHTESPSLRDLLHTVFTLAASCRTTEALKSFAAKNGDALLGIVMAYIHDLEKPAVRARSERVDRFRQKRSTLRNRLLKSASA